MLAVCSAKALVVAFLLAVSPAHAVELRSTGDTPANGTPLSGQLALFNRSTALLARSLEALLADRLELGPITWRSDYWELDLGNDIIGSHRLDIWARDAFTVRWASAVLYTAQRYTYGAGRAQLDVALVPRLSFVFAGGASGERGSDIVAFADAGLRLGLAQSFALLATAGVSAAIADAGATTAGPLVSLGAQWQL